MCELATTIVFDDIELKMKTIVDKTGLWTYNNDKPENDLVSHVLRRDHCWEPYQTEVTIELLKTLQPSIFLDIGAHIGYYSLIAAAYGWSVESYEMNPLYFKILDDNIQDNNFKELITSHKIRVAPEHTIDSIINGRKIGIIKIDVEGAEPEIIQGLQKSLANQLVDSLIIEISPKFRDHETLIKLIQNIQSYGYNYYDLGLSPQRHLDMHTHHLQQLPPFDIADIYKISQTNLLFIKKNLLQEIADQQN